jgi:hypothetical protein
MFRNMLLVCMVMAVTLGGMDREKQRPPAEVRRNVFEKLEKNLAFLERYYEKLISNFSQYAWVGYAFQPNKMYNSRLSIQHGLEKYRTEYKESAKFFNYLKKAPINQVNWAEVDNIVQPYNGAQNEEKSSEKQPNLSEAYEQKAKLAATGMREFMRGNTY